MSEKPLILDYWGRKHNNHHSKNKLAEERYSLAEAELEREANHDKNDAEHDDHQNDRKYGGGVHCRQGADKVTILVVQEHLL